MRWLVVTLAVLLLVLQYRLWFGEGSFAQKAGLERQVEEQAARNEVLVERNRVLMEEVAGLKSGLDAIEERARTDLGMIKQDETFFLVVDSRVKKREMTPSPQAESARRIERQREDDAADSIPTGLEAPDTTPDSSHEPEPGAGE